ncbi:MAG: PHP domain-containing protein, partial [Chloroflexota bacterium]
MTTPAYAELHCHTNFSFLDGASAPDDVAARAAALGLAGVAVTDHNGLYGTVRFAAAMEAAGVRPVIGIEIELLDAAAVDPGGIVVPARRSWKPGRRPPVADEAPPVEDGRPRRPRPDRARLPGHRTVVKEDHRGIGEGQRGPHLVLLARDAIGWRSLCRLVSRANLAGSKAVPRFTTALLEEHHEGLIALSGCRHGELARRLLAGDREGARAAAQRYAAIFGTADSAAGSGFVLELSHHLLPDDDWLASETARLASEVGLPVVVTNDVHYALPADREMHDVITAIRHGRTLAELADLRRPDGESYLKGADDLLAMPPGDEAVTAADPVLARAWREGIAASVEIAGACRVELAFERYRFPGFPVPKGQTPFSHLSELCWEGARRRYHPLTPAVVKQLAHELDVIEKTGLAEFFLICWDLMQFARSRHIPAQGRGSAADSIVAYVLGITRVDPIRHELLFERFINEGRTAYPDVDIDFSSERREEVIQYVYNRYGQEHTGMVCNLVTYRARSAVREVGLALGFPRPLVDRVAKALETYDSVMVRRDLEAEGGFASFFERPADDAALGADAARGSRRLVAEVAVAGAAAMAAERGLTDPMGQLKHARGGRLRPPASADTGTWEGAPGSAPAIRAGARGDDEGGPGDTPASVAWLRAGRGTGYSPTSGRNTAPAPDTTGDRANGGVVTPAAAGRRPGATPPPDSSSPAASAAPDTTGDRAWRGPGRGPVPSTTGVRTWASTTPPAATARSGIVGGAGERAGEAEPPDSTNPDRRRASGGPGERRAPAAGPSGRNLDWRTDPDASGARAEGWAPYREVVEARRAAERIHPETGVLTPEPRRTDAGHPATAADPTT